MKRKKKRKSKKSKCHCRKPPSLANMKLTTLRTHAKKVEKAIEHKIGNLGVVRRRA